jgi:cytochrome c-type biogenesis protein CcmE
MACQPRIHAIDVVRPALARSPVRHRHLVIARQTCLSQKGPWRRFRRAQRFRLGGHVPPGSLVRGDNMAMTFNVADGGASLTVSYKGILPDLFREGQGVVAEGALDGAGVFRADTVLAKHDETYMPKEVADTLMKQGHWKDDYGAKTAVSAASPRAANAERR